MINPIHISCANGANSFCDICVERFGDLIRIYAHPETILDRKAAKDLITAMLSIINEQLENEKARDEAVEKITDAESAVCWENTNGFISKE